MIRYFVDYIEHYANTKYNKCIEISPFAIPYYDLTFVLEGTMVYHINGLKYTLRKNDVVFLPPGTIRSREYAVVNVRYVSYNFHLIKDAECNLPIYMPNTVTEEIKNLLLGFHFPTIQNKHYDHEKCVCILNAILYELINLNSYPTSNKYVLDMLRYISTHITEAISLNTLCQFTNLSREYCSYLFKKETGETVVSYINRKKMQYAKDLILHNEMTLQDISEYLGYSNYNYFSRTYKKYHSYPPQKTLSYNSTKS